jgi:hypothetical protein
MAQELRTTGAKCIPERQRDNEDIVELAGNRDEVGYEVDRDRQIADQSDQSLSAADATNPTASAT